MSTRNTRNSTPQDSIQINNLDAHLYKQSRWRRFVQRQYKWIISIAIVLALLAMSALLIPPHFPTRTAAKIDRAVYRTRQAQLQPVIAQPLAKNTENILGLNGNVVSVSDDAGNNVYGLQRNSGTLVWQYHETHATLETVDGQHLYLVEQSGTQASIRALNLNDGKTLWQHTFSNHNIASMEVEGAFLYATDQHDTLYVLQSSDGASLWHYDFPANTAYTQADGVTLAYTEDGRSLWALRANNGRLLWHIAEHTSSWPLTASAGITFLQTQDHYLKALNSQNGQQIWQSSIATVADNPVKIVGTTGYINTANGLIKAVHITDGRTLWQYKPAKPIQGEVTLNGSVLYATGLDDMIYALASGTGKLLWQQHINNLTSDFVVAGTSLYIHASDGFAYALDATTGAQQWSKNLTQTNSYRIAVLDASHTFYLIGANQTLTAFNSTTGSFLWGQSGLNLPLFSDNNIFVSGNNGGSINAIDPATGTLQWYVPVSH